MVEKGNAYRILVRKPAEKNSLVDLGVYERTPLTFIL
jgi:hypothetical protein